MRKLGVVVFAVALVLALATSAQAFQVTLATKNITVNFTITPSPIAYNPGTTGTAIAQHTWWASPEQFDRMLAYEPFSTSDMVAQTNPQSSVKVQFTVKPDPTYQYFHLTPGANMNLNTAYGPNTWTCVFTVFASYTTAWTVTDFTYGSNTTGGTAGFNGFPVYNYPTASLLQWLAETVTSSYTAYSNSGPPGQTSFTGTAGQSRTVCIDLSLNVPSNIPAGSYSATLSYRMTHN